MNILVKRIPRASQRYDTSGDYWMDKKGVMQVRISANNTKEFFLILIHELIEAFISKFNGIKWTDIDNFDISNPDLDEPGDSINAPYFKEHQFATAIEKVLADNIGVDWKEYNGC